MELMIFFSRRTTLISRVCDDDFRTPQRRFSPYRNRSQPLSEPSIQFSSKWRLNASNPCFATRYTCPPLVSLSHV